MLGIGLSLSFMLNTFWPLLFSAVIFTMGEIISVPFSQTLRADMMNEEKLGAYSGAFSATYPLGSGLAGGMITLSHYVGSAGVALLLLVTTGLSIF